MYLSPSTPDPKPGTLLRTGRCSGEEGFSADTSAPFLHPGISVMVQDLGIRVSGLGFGRDPEPGTLNSKP